MTRVLVVDDEPMIVELLQQILEDEGYDVEIAYNGQQALELLGHNLPDIVLSDVMMPVMDGLALCQELKSREETRLIPVVIMTALGDKKDRIRGIKAGADDFLTKPVDDDELLARIENCLALRQSFRDQMQYLESARRQLSKFVPDTVERLVLENPLSPELEKRRRDVTVVFVDISDYSKLSEELAVDELNAVVETYFSAYLDVLRRFGGDINETAGDGFMALFVDSDPLRHAQQAVSAALAIMDLTAKLNSQRSEPKIAIHVGINSGLAFVGSTQLSSETKVRLTFTATGPVTNIAARILSCASAGQILIGPETASRMLVQDSNSTPSIQSIGERLLKNITIPVELFSVKSQTD